MTLADWRTVIADAAALDIAHIQLIGGEPTLYPYWRELVDLSLSLGRTVEVYGNLYKVPPAAWATFERPGVSLATSYYSDTPAEHDTITTRPGSYHRTRSKTRARRTATTVTPRAPNRAPLRTAPPMVPTTTERSRK